MKLGDGIGNQNILISIPKTFNTDNAQWIYFKIINFIYIDYDIDFIIMYSKYFFYLAQLNSRFLTVFLIIEELSNIYLWVLAAMSYSFMFALDISIKSYYFNSPRYLYK